MKMPSDIGSTLERAFDTQWRALASDLPKPSPNYQFAQPRRWAIDRAWPPYKVGVELEGGQFGKRVVCHNCGTVVRGIDQEGKPGREIRLSGAHGGNRFTADREKYNTAQMAGWVILSFVHQDVIENPAAMVETIRQALENRAYAVRPEGQVLSPHQESILHLVAGGLTTPDIANRLNTTDEAVRRHIQRICDRLQVTNRPSAVARALVWGLIEPQRIPWSWELYAFSYATGTASAEVED